MSVTPLLVTGCYCRPAAAAAVVVEGQVHLLPLLSPPTLPRIQLGPGQDLGSLAEDMDQVRGTVNDAAGDKETASLIGAGAMAFCYDDTDCWVFL